MTDTSTGLYWEKTGDCVRYNTFEEAQSRIDELNQYSKNTWRLPTKMELVGISTYIQNNLIIDADVFWTSEGGWVYYTTDWISYPSNVEESRVLAVTETDPDFTHDEFIDNGDGTTTDTTTGLIWKIEDNGYAVSKASADTYIDILNLELYNDWRLPTISELQVMSEYIINFPCFDGDENYWTSNSDSFGDFCIAFIDHGSSIEVTTAWCTSSRVLAVRAPDKDLDGIPDSIDNCVDDYNPDQSDIDSDNVGDVCDGCPEDPLKTEAGTCGCGVADTDTDSDGTPDCNDNCPAVSNADQLDLDSDTIGDACDDDVDGDGYTTDVDCDDSDASVNPEATEVCNGIDDNCDEQIDEGVKNTYYQDSDGDGYGDPINTIQSCTQPSGYVDNNVDCDDTNGAINPFATEVCDDGIDNDCNGDIDSADANCTVNVDGGDGTTKNGGGSSGCFITTVAYGL